MTSRQNALFELPFKKPRTATTAGIKTTVRFLSVVVDVSAFGNSTQLRLASYILGQTSMKVEPAAGDFVCFLEKNKIDTTYGILVNNLPTIAICGTYLMTCTDRNEPSGKLVTVSRKALHVAWLRMNNHDETSPYKKKLPRAALESLYAMHMENPPLLYDAVAIFEEEYRASIDAELAEQWKVKEAKKKAQQDKPQTKASKKKKGTQGACCQICCWIKARSVF
jgi:hypothetical protein